MTVPPPIVIATEDGSSTNIAPTSEVNLNLTHSSSSVVDDLTEDPSASGSIPPPEPKVSTPPHILSVQTFSDNNNLISDLISSNMESRIAVTTNRHQQNAFEDEETEDPVTPQMATSSRHSYPSYCADKSTPKITGGAPSLTSSTRTVKSMSSSIIDYGHPDAVTSTSWAREGRETPSVRSDLAGWVIDAKRSNATSNNGAVDPQRVPLVVVEKQQTHSRNNSHGHWSHVVHGNSVSSTNSTVVSLKKAIQEVQIKLERSLKEMQESNTRDLERLITTIQQESNKRISSLESRLHAQLLLQSETMVAMELKLLRLESKVERREAMLMSQQQQQRRKLYASYPVTTTIDEEGSIVNSGELVDRNSHADEDNIESIEFKIPYVGSNVYGGTVHNRNIRRSGGGGSTSARRSMVSAHPLPPATTLLSNVAHRSNPTNIAIMSSGASLTSAVTAMSFLDGEGSTHLDAVDDIGDEADVEDTADGVASTRSGDADYEDEDAVEDDEHDGSASTPTQGSSRRQISHSDAVIWNRISNSVASERGLSTRATRGDFDGNSSLATSVTNTTFSSTVITSTTRGGDSINPRSLSQITHDGLHEDEVETDHALSCVGVSSHAVREDFDSMLGLSPPAVAQRTRSRSQSPITVQSVATASVEPLSMASASVTTSILSTAAVAPARPLRGRRDAVPSRATNADNRAMANRVVTFTSNDVYAIPQEIVEGGDSITVPDELDNLSEVADIFAERARVWREEYEARLEELQKRWGAD